MAYTDQTNRVGSLILRFFALGLNIASIIMLAIGFPTGMLIHIILVLPPSFSCSSLPPAHASQQGQQLTRPQFIIVALWGLVDFVLLLCKRFHHPGINVALDLIAVLILVIMGVFGTAVFRDIGFTYNDIKALRIGIIVAFFSA